MLCITQRASITEKVRTYIGVQVAAECATEAAVQRHALRHQPPVPSPRYDLLPRPHLALLHSHEQGGIRVLHIVVVRAHFCRLS